MKKKLVCSTIILGISKNFFDSLWSKKFCTNLFVVSFHGFLVNFFCYSFASCSWSMWKNGNWSDNFCDICKEMKRWRRFVFIFQRKKCKEFWNCNDLKLLGGDELRTLRRLVPPATSTTSTLFLTFVAFEVLALVSRIFIKKSTLALYSTKISFVGPLRKNKF